MNERVAPRIEISGLNSTVQAIFVVGEWDLASAKGLRTCLFAYAVDDVIFDLTRVTFMDSTILGVLVGAVQHAADLNSGIRVACVINDECINLVHILKISGLYSLLPIYPTLYAARKALGSTFIDEKPSLIAAFNDDMMRHPLWTLIKGLFRK